MVFHWKRFLVSLTIYAAAGILFYTAYTRGKNFKGNSIIITNHRSKSGKGLLSVNETVAKNPGIELDPCTLNFGLYRQ